LPIDVLNEALWGWHVDLWGHVQGVLWSSREKMVWKATFSQWAEWELYS
jgi:hypothetical protein